MVQGGSNSEVWLRQVIFFFLWVGRVAPLFSGEDTVQGKEEKRVIKKKEGCHVRSVGRSVWSRQDRHRQTSVDVWTCGQTRTWRERTLEGRDVFGGSSGWVCRRK